MDDEKCGGGGKIKEMSEKWLDCGRTKRRYLCANDMTAFFFSSTTGTYISCDFVVGGGYPYIT